MDVEVRGRGVEISDGLRAYVARRVNSALRRRASRVHSVQVWLEDVNGPKGGEDKRCRIRLAGPGLAGLLVAASDSDVRAALAAAVERIVRALDRLVRRSTDVTRSSPTASTYSRGGTQGA